MKRTDLERLDDLCNGVDPGTPNGNNLGGAIRNLLDTYDDAREWGATPDDADWDEFHEDLQAALVEVVNIGAEALQKDGVLEDAGGNALAELPEPAKDATKTVDVPPRGGGPP